MIELDEAPDASQHYLFDYLEDEFRSYPELRLRSTKNSKDRGVFVRTETREYYFSASWVDEGDFRKVQELVNRIKDVLPER